MTYHQTLRELAERTDPDPAAVQRVHARLSRALTPTTALLDQLPEVDPAAATRVRARLAEGRRRRVPVAAWAGGLALAAAAVAGVVLSTTGGTPEPVALALAEVGHTTVGDHVQLEWEGTGEADGTDRDVGIDWEDGRLSAAVVPGAGVTLQVRTREATVDVVGTAFDVERSALGTRVVVDEGRVSVRCHRAGDGTAERVVTAGQLADCLPVSAAGMLGRAQALRDADTGDDQVLAAVTDGLSLVGPDDTAVHVELRVEQMGALLREGRHPEARQAAEAALQLGAGARAEELHRAVARIALLAGDCTAALPHLDALQAPTPEERAHQQRCSSR